MLSNFTRSDFRYWIRMSSDRSGRNKRMTYQGALLTRTADDYSFHSSLLTAAHPLYNTFSSQPCASAQPQSLVLNPQTSFLFPPIYSPTLNSISFTFSISSAGACHHCFSSNFAMVGASKRYFFTSAGDWFISSLSYSTHARPNASPLIQTYTKYLKQSDGLTAGDRWTI